MIDFTQVIANIFTVAGTVDVIEFFVFITMAIYTFLAFILTRQVRLMNRSFTTPLGPMFRMLSFIHFGAAIIVTTLTFFVM
jgi:hypothetical protein